jgi:hypothetical protein
MDTSVQALSGTAAVGVGCITADEDAIVVRCKSSSHALADFVSDDSLVGRLVTCLGFLQCPPMHFLEL